MTFDDVTVLNKTDMWGVEWMYLMRTHPAPLGGIYEFGLGVRYMEFTEAVHRSAAWGIQIRLPLEI